MVSVLPIYSIYSHIGTQYTYTIVVYNSVNNSCDKQTNIRCPRLKYFIYRHIASNSCLPAFVTTGQRLCIFMHKIKWNLTTTRLNDLTITGVHNVHKRLDKNESTTRSWTVRHKIQDAYRTQAPHGARAGVWKRSVHLCIKSVDDGRWIRT